MARPKAATPEAFADLVAAVRAELAAADLEDRTAMLARPRRVAPACFKGLGWVRGRVNLAEACELTGLARNSLRVYAAAGRKAAAEGTATERTMPAGDNDTGWQIGALALWMATRNESQATRSRRWPERDERVAAHIPEARRLLARRGGRMSVLQLSQKLGITRELAAEVLTAAGGKPARTPDAELLAVLRPVVERTTRWLMISEVVAVLEEAGYVAGHRRARRLLFEAGGRGLLIRDPGSPELLPLESLRNDGKVTTGQLAEAFGVNSSAISNAVKGRRLTQVGPGLFDPANIRARFDGWKGPVDADHPKASPDPLPLPGQRD